MSYTRDIGNLWRQEMTYFQRTLSSCLYVPWHERWTNEDWVVCESMIQELLSKYQTLLKQENKSLYDIHWVILIYYAYEKWGEEILLNERRKVLFHEKLVSQGCTAGSGRADMLTSDVPVVS
jgi:hypothetical protein